MLVTTWEIEETSEHTLGLSLPVHLIDFLAWAIRNIITVCTPLVTVSCEESRGTKQDNWPFPHLTVTALFHGSLYRIWNMGTIIIFEYLDRYSSIDLMPERIALQQQHNTCPIFWINVSHSHWKTNVLVTVVSLSILCTDPWNHAPRARPFVRIQCEVYANRIVSRHVSRVACPRYNPLNNFPNIQNDPIQDLLHCSARGHTIYRTGTKIYILRNWWQHNDAKLFLQIYIYTVCRIFVSKSNK